MTRKKKKVTRIQISGENLKKLEEVLDRYNNVFGDDNVDEYDEFAYQLWCKIYGIDPSKEG